MSNAQGLTVGQWWMMRLWVERQLGEEVPQMDRSSILEVMRRCFSCQGRLPSVEIGLDDGLCPECRRKRVWERN
jgi:hypothetical protein